MAAAVRSPAAAWVAAASRDRKRHQHPSCSAHGCLAPGLPGVGGCYAAAVRGCGLLYRFRQVEVSHMQQGRRVGALVSHSKGLCLPIQWHQQKKPAAAMCWTEACLHHPVGRHQQVGRLLRPHFRGAQQVRRAPSACQQPRRAFAATLPLRHPHLQSPPPPLPGLGAGLRWGGRAGTAFPWRRPAPAAEAQAQSLSADQGTSSTAALARPAHQ